MKKLVPLALIASIVLVGCGDGGSKTETTNGAAAPPPVKDAQSGNETAKPASPSTE